MKLLSYKTASALAIIGYFGYQWANTVVSKISYKFTGFTFLDFWANLAKFKIVCQTTLNIQNDNDFDIEVVKYVGQLSYKAAKVTDIRITKSVKLAPGKLETMSFQFETKILEAVARLFLAFTDKKNYDGGEVSGTLSVKLKGFPLSIPRKDPVSISL